MNYSHGMPVPRATASPDASTEWKYIAVNPSNLCPAKYARVRRKERDKELYAAIQAEFDALKGSDLSKNIRSMLARKHGVSEGTVQSIVYQKRFNS
jgi:hypothetical protein